MLHKLINRVLSLFGYSLKPYTFYEAEYSLEVLQSIRKPCNEYQPTCSEMPFTASDIKLITHVLGMCK